MQFDTDMINSLIQNRRSTFISQFVAGKRIPDEIIWQALENANRAPTHKLTEPWRFTVFSGDGLQKMAAFQAALYKAESDKIKQDKYEKLLSNPLQCSHVIAVGMKRSNKVPEIEEIEAVACAVQNIYLTITAYGVGGYFSTGGITYYDEARSFFGLGEHDKLLGFFYIGYVATPSLQSKRQPVKDKVRWIE